MANLLAPMPLLRSFIGITDQVEDKFIEQIAAGVTGRFQQFCCRDFFRSATTTEYHDADGTECFVVDAPPIVGITDIWVSGDATWDATTVIDDDYYEYDADTGVVFWRNYSPPTEGLRAIRIVYTSGWELKAMPEALIRAFLAQVRHEYRQKDNMAVHRITDAYGNASEPIGFELLPEVRDTLNMYRLIRL